MRKSCLCNWESVCSELRETKVSSYDNTPVCHSLSLLVHLPHTLFWITSKCDEVMSISVTFNPLFSQVLLCGGGRQHTPVCDCDTLWCSSGVEAHSAGAARRGQWRGIRYNWHQAAVEEVNDTLCGNITIPCTQLTYAVMLGLVFRWVLIKSQS